MRVCETLLMNILLTLTRCKMKLYVREGRDLYNRVRQYKLTMQPNSVRQYQLTTMRPNRVR
jgi:hypothetical protein